ncbi:MAG: effector binding domain-containing protein [Rhodococcus sp. (in: high G+C Gram-positive bacteria)]
MTFRLLARPGVVFGGLVVPGVDPGNEGSASDLVVFMRERIREREPEGVDVYTVYVPDQRGVSNVVVGVPRATVDDVPTGDVFVTVPSGVFAVFTPSLMLPDRAEDAWAQVDDALAEGAIARAGGVEFECLSADGNVEIFVSILLQ